MKVFVDKDTCIGCGNCVEVCPEVFKMGDDGLSEVFAFPTPLTESCAREACDTCPVAAIGIEE